MLSATFYHDGTGRPCANGHSYAWNARHYGAFCAGNRWALGTHLELASRSGRRVRVTVVDRIGSGSDVDCSETTFAALAGSRYKVVGRLPVRVRVLSRPRKNRGRR